MSTVVGPLLQATAVLALIAITVAFCCWRDIAEWFDGFREELRGGTR